LTQIDPYMLLFKETKHTLQTTHEGEWWHPRLMPARLVTQDAKAGKSTCTHTNTIKAAENNQKTLDRIN